MNDEAPLGERIDRDYLAAMKSRDAGRISALRMLKAAMQSAEKTAQRSLSDDEVEAVVVREMKTRRESLLEFERGARPDLAATETEAINIIAGYMPPQLSEDEVTAIVAEAVAGLGESARADPRAAMGLVMRVVMPQVKGKADGNLVNQIVRSELDKST